MKPRFGTVILLAACYAVALGQWEPDQRLTFNGSESYTCRNNTHSIGSSGDTVHVVWHDRRDGNTEVYYKRSVNCGVSWGEDVRLTSDSEVSYGPGLACAGQYLHVVWRDERDGNREVYYKRSPDGGSTWGMDTRLTNDTALSYNPSVAAADSLVHVVWMEYRDGQYPEIYYKRSTDCGEVWDPDLRLTYNESRSYNPAVAACGGDVHVVWDDYRDGNWEVYYKRSIDAGATWFDDVRLTEDPAVSDDPAVAVADSCVYVTWFDERVGNQEIYAKRSVDAGLTWGPDTRITDAQFSSHGSVIAASGQNVHLAWVDMREGYMDIYYARSVDAGATWEADTRLTSDSAESYRPGIAVTDTAVYVAWYDFREGNYEIYYKRNPSGNIVGLSEQGAVRSEDSMSARWPSVLSGLLECRSAKLYDAAGRRVSDNWRGRLGSGVYFAVVRGSGLTRIVKVR